MRTAYDEPACWIDVIYDRPGDQLFGQDRVDDLVDHILTNLLVGDLGAVLGGNNDRIHADRLVAAELDGHLALAVGPQPGNLFGETGCRKPGENAVSQGDGQRHQLRGVVAGVTEHQSLIAGPDLLALGRVLVHALGNVRALPVQREQYRTGVGRYAVLVVDIADFANHLADNFRIVDRRGGRDLACHYRHARSDQRLTSDAAEGVFGKQGIENTIGNLVGEFVGVSHADRLACEQELALGHEESPELADVSAVESSPHRRSFRP